MLPMHVSPTDQLVDIRDVVPRSDNDQPLFDELYEVLRKHNALKRFGITLLHQHFEVTSDEVLLGTTDRSARVQTIQPVSKSKINSIPYIETAWRLDHGPKPIMSCICVKMGSDHSHQHRPSDVTLKMEIEPLRDALNKLLRIEPKSYQYNATAIASLQVPDGRQHGFIAQELEAIFPELVITKNPGKDNEYKAVDYTGLIPVLVAAVQEQQAEIAALRSKLLADSDQR